jgi:hypothetical protein
MLRIIWSGYRSRFRQCVSLNRPQANSSAPAGVNQLAGCFVRIGVGVRFDKFRGNPQTAPT